MREEREDTRKKDRMAALETESTTTITATIVAVMTARPAAALVRRTAANIPQPVSELSGSALVQFALQTLACFNFTGHELLEFARESVVVYLDDEDGATRKDAALCCCKLVANSFSVEALLDGAAVTKREVAVATLRQVVQSTGYVRHVMLLLQSALCMTIEKGALNGN
ncbi:hypothetical protein POUND7_005921 [Theobroma cacao]